MRKTLFPLLLFPLILSACSSQKKQTEAEIAKKIKFSLAQKLPRWATVSTAKCEITAESGFEFTGQVQISIVAKENVYERITGKSLGGLVKFAESMNLRPGAYPSAVTETFERMEKDAERETDGYRLITPQGTQWSLSAPVDGRIEGTGVVITRVGTPTSLGKDIQTVGVVPHDELPPGSRIYESQDEVDRAFEAVLLEERPARIEKAKAALHREAEEIARREQADLRKKEELHARIKAAFPETSYSGNLRYYGDYPVAMEIKHLGSNRFEARIALVDKPDVFQIFEGPGGVVDGLPCLTLSPTAAYKDRGFVPPLFKASSGYLKLMRDGETIKGEANSGGNGSTLTLRIDNR